MRHRDRGVPYRRLLIAGAVVSLIALALAVDRPGFLVRLDDDLYDSMTRNAPREQPSGRVIIVDIDERSLTDIGQWPWPRNVVGQLIDRIRDAGAAAVALDIVFPERDREVLNEPVASPPTPDPGSSIRPPTPTDAALAETLRKGNVVLGYAMTFDESAPHRDCLMHPLRAACARTGRLQIAPEAR